jgi:hypothetical protein
MAALLLAPACGRLGYDTEGVPSSPSSSVDAGTLPVTTFDGSFPAGQTPAFHPRYQAPRPGGTVGRGPGTPGTPYYR